MESNQSFIPGIPPEMLSHGAALALLGTVFVCGCSVLVAALFFVRGSRPRALIALAVAPAMLVLYTGTLLTLSLISRDRILGHSEEKHFCELDCHLAYAVTDVTLADSLGSGVGLRPHGRFCVVALRARFDPETVAPWRPEDAPMFPDPRELVLLDDRGHALGVSLEAQRALDKVGAAGAPLYLPLLPGASATSRLVFDIPNGFQPTRILLRDKEIFNRFVLADELSWLHARTYWRF